MHELGVSTMRIIRLMLVAERARTGALNESRLP
jgi:hypothetical protein